MSQVNIRRYNVVCGTGQCEWQEQAAGRLQNWQLQEDPDPQLVEVSTLPADHLIPDRSSVDLRRTVTHRLL